MTAPAVSESEASPSGWLASLSLRQRILLLLALAGLPGIAVAVYLAASWLHGETEQIEVSVERLAKLAAARQDMVIENARVVVSAVAQRYSAGELASEGCAAYLDGWLNDLPALTALSLFDEGGVQICASEGAEMPSNVSGTDWFGETREAAGFVLGRYAVGTSEQPVLIAAHPIRSDDAFRGAVGLGVDLRWLNYLSQTIALPDGATVTAVGPEGQMLFHNSAAPAEDGAEPGAEPSRAALKQMAALISGSVRAENQSGSPRVYGVQQTQSGDLVVAVGHTPYLDYARYRDAMINTLASPLIVLVLALIAAGWGSETFVARYVRSLTRTAEAIGAGDLSARSEIPYGKYEIGRLAAAFDSMASAIEHDQDELENLVEERQFLIRELNHRVKNNLQLVLSMLRGAGRDPQTDEHLKTVSGRIHTLARIHQMLYQRYDSAVPPLNSYVRELTTLLGEFYEAEVGVANIEADVSDVDLTIGQSISFGLVLNELVANAQKHAFADGRAGRIAITVAIEDEDDGQWVHLCVSDNGVGLPDDFEIGDTSTMGSRLLRGLARQLNGDIDYERLDRGTAMHLRFPADS